MPRSKALCAVAAVLGVATIVLDARPLAVVVLVLLWSGLFGAMPPRTNVWLWLSWASGWVVIALFASLPFWSGA